MKIRDWMAVLALVGIVIGGCDWFEDPSPQSVSVTIDGPAGDSIRVVTSTVFVAAQDELGSTTVNPLASDTTVWILPISRMFDIREDQRFLLMAMPGDSASTVPIQANIRVDSRSPFATSFDMTQIKPLLYLFLFNQEVLSDFQLI